MRQPRRRIVSAGHRPACIVSVRASESFMQIKTVCGKPDLRSRHTLCTYFTSRRAPRKPRAREDLAEIVLTALPGIAFAFGRAPVR